MGKKYDIGICLSCNARQLVRHAEWIKAARVRCIKCGGPVDPSPSADEEHKDQEDVAKELSRRVVKPSPSNRGHIVT